MYLMPGVEVLLVLEHVAGGVGVGAPGVVDGGLDVRRRLRRRREADRDRQPQLLPLEIEVRLVVGEVGDQVGEPLAERRRLGLELHAQQILVGLVVVAGAGLVGLLVEDDRPLGLARNDEERVRPRGDGLAREGDVLVEGDLGGRVRARAPHLIVGDQAAPDLASFDAGAAVVDGDLRQADDLPRLGERARARQLEIGAGGRR